MLWLRSGGPHRAVMVAAGICLPFPPSSTVWFPTVMMKHDCISRTDYIGCQQADSAKFQHIVATFMDNTSRAIQATVKNLITLDVNGLYS